MSDYSKRRKAVIRKLKVLAQNKNFGMGAKANVQFMLKQLPPESMIITERQRRGAMQALEVAEKSDLYSVTGQRRIAKRKIEALKQYGVKISSYKELSEFGEFMESVREYSLNHVYDSTKALEIYMDKSRGESNEELLNKYRDWRESRE